MTTQAATTITDFIVVPEKKAGLGTFMGVFVPSILMIFGVIIFLRLGWIVGQAGLPSALAIISLSTFIALVTTLSMASISTNINVGKGGVYYLLSRSLGIEIGSAIGIPLYIKQCLSIAFCVIGFAESLHDLVPALSITTIGVITLLALTLLAYFSLSGALRVQVFIFIVLMASLVSFFMGGKEMLTTHASPNLSLETQGLSFWVIFSIFFPAITGIESSVSLSGDLKNPGKSLPLGTVSALLFGYAVYMTIPIFLHTHIPRELLINDPFIMQAVAKVPALIVLGVWGATISSALGGLLGAPRTLQALADDGVVPRFLGKTFGASQEPRITTLLTCLIALCCIYFGSVNLIAPMLTMICLICYAVLNLSTAFETLMDNPSWRPRFRVHWGISMLGFAMCIMAMLMISPGYAILAALFISLMYLIAKKRAFQNSWEDIRQGVLVFFSRLAIHNLDQGELNSRSWRPHFLVFAKKEEHALLHFSKAISRNKNFITMASFVNSPFSEHTKKKLQNEIRQELQKHHIHALVQVNYSEQVHQGMLHMIENYGLGPLTPNVILIGSHKQDDLESLAVLIRTTYRKQRSLIIFNSKEESLNSLAPSTNEIHVWEHPFHKSNGEFMLVLAYMLSRNPGWKKSKICLQKIVSCESERAQAQKDAKDLSIEQRLQLEINILVSSEPNQDYTKHIASISGKAGLIFLSLTPPKKESSPTEYAAYVKEMMGLVQTLPQSALVLSSKSGPFDDILNQGATG